MAEDAFRADLYFRLSVHQIDIPPLRERKEDIPVLVAFFAAEAADSLGKKPPEAPPELLTCSPIITFPATCGSCGPWSSMQWRAIRPDRCWR